MAGDSRLTSLHPDGTTYETIGDAVVAWRFEGVETEYRALRTEAVVVDGGSGGLTAVVGDAVPFLNEVLARDVEYLGTERCMTSLVLGLDGAPLDLVTVYGLEDGFLIESSTGQGSSTARHLTELAPPDVDIVDLRSERSLLSIEGPYAWSKVAQLLDQELTTLPYESVVETEWGGDPLLFARAGVTGEYGYKLIADLDVIERLWKELLLDTVAMGQETLETAMLEVRQPIFHRELLGSNVLEAGANWLVDLSKDEFRGRSAVEHMWREGSYRARVGLRVECDEPAALIGAAVVAGDAVIGAVAHAVFSPSLHASIALATIDRDFASAGLTLACHAADDASMDATSLSSPYVVPTSWGVPIF